MYKSLDNGTTWSPVNTGLPHLNARRIKAVRKDGKLTLILTLTTVGRSDNPSSYQGGVYRSTDAGGTWTSINGDLPRYQSGDSLSYFYWKFIVDPTNPEIIYVGTTRGWPRDDLAAYEEYGIYKTTNGGQSWRKVSTTVIDDWMDTGFYSERHAFVLELAPSEPEVIYWGLVWMKKSTDGGASWKQINSTKVGNAWETNGLELMVVDAITYHPVNPTVLYIGYDDFGIFRSDDGGRSFWPLDPKQDPFSGYDAAKDIAVDPSNGDLFVSRYEGLAFALANGFAKGGVWKSSDQGVAWTRLSNGLPDGTPKLIMDTTSGRSGSRTLYCTIYGSGVYKTTNGGASWGPSNNGLGADSSKAWEIALSPTNTNLLYLGLNALSGGGCYKSTDGGTSWRKLSSFPNHVVFGITIGPQNGFVYAATTDDFWYSTVGGVYRSTD
ncbi:MAG TPA: hypothetical protein DCP63_09460, partial [Bacteroidetes bacterium]|nr:hypothetical protein [Bacteroidota bacterium]